MALPADQAGRASDLLTARYDIEAPIAVASRDPARFGRNADSGETRNQTAREGVRALPAIPSELRRYAEVEIPADTVERRAALWRDRIAHHDVGGAPPISGSSCVDLPHTQAPTSALPPSRGHKRSALPREHGHTAAKARR